MSKTAVSGRNMETSADASRAGSAADPRERFSIHARLQHGMLAVSLAVLMFTGFPIKFAGRPWTFTIVDFFGSFENLLRVHFAAATLLVLVTVYYLGTLVVALARKRLEFAIVPRISDFRTFGHHLAYLVGRRADPPKFGKFTWWEKFEFWAVVWGTSMMGLSGLTLAFPEIAARYVPRWLIGALRVAHSNEALLALLALVVGHLFAVHLSPHVFPTSTVWLNGRLSLVQLHEDHALLYESLAEHDPSVAAQVRPSRWAGNRALIAAELLVYVVVIAGIYYTLVPLLLR